MEEWSPSHEGEGGKGWERDSLLFQSEIGKLGATRSDTSDFSWRIAVLILDFAVGPLPLRTLAISVSSWAKPLTILTGLSLLGKRSLGWCNYSLSETSRWMDWWCCCLCGWLFCICAGKRTGSFGALTQWGSIKGSTQKHSQPEGNRCPSGEGDEIPIMKPGKLWEIADGQLQDANSRLYTVTNLGLWKCTA